MTGRKIQNGAWGIWILFISGFIDGAQHTIGECLRDQKMCVGSNGKRYFYRNHINKDMYLITELEYRGSDTTYNLRKPYQITHVGMQPSTHKRRSNNVITPKHQSSSNILLSDIEISVAKDTTLKKYCYIGPVTYADISCNGILKGERITVRGRSSVKLKIYGMSLYTEWRLKFRFDPKVKDLNNKNLKMNAPKIKAIEFQTFDGKYSMAKFQPTLLNFTEIFNAPDSEINIFKRVVFTKESNSACYYIHVSAKRINKMNNGGFVISYLQVSRFWKNSPNGKTCSKTIWPFNWLLTIRTGVRSGGSNVSLVLRIDKSKPLKFDLSASLFRENSSDIFFLSNEIESDGIKYITVTNQFKESTDWIMKEIILHNYNKNSTYTFPHGEKLWKQRYYVPYNDKKNTLAPKFAFQDGSKIISVKAAARCGQDAVNITIEVKTGAFGTDHGIVIQILGDNNCKNNITLDRPNDDFLPNSTDEFNVMVKNCSGFNEVTIDKWTWPNHNSSTLGWTFEMMTIYKDKKAVMEVNHGEFLIASQTFYRNQTSGDNQWNITVRSNDSIDGQVSVRLEGQTDSINFYRLSTPENDFEPDKDSNFMLFLKDIGSLKKVSVKIGDIFQNWNIGRIWLQSETEKFNFTMIRRARHDAIVNFTADYTHGLCQGTGHTGLQLSKVEQCTDKCLQDSTCGGFKIPCNIQTVYGARTKLLGYSLNITSVHLIESVNLISAEDLVLSYSPTSPSKIIKKSLCEPNKRFETLTQIVALSEIECDTSTEVKLGEVYFADHDTYLVRQFKITKTEHQGYCRWNGYLKSLKKLTKPQPTSAPFTSTSTEKTASLPSNGANQSVQPIPPMSPTFTSNSTDTTVHLPSNGANQSVQLITPTPPPFTSNSTDTTAYLPSNGTNRSVQPISPMSSPFTSNSTHTTAHLPSNGTNQSVQTTTPIPATINGPVIPTTVNTVTTTDSLCICQCEKRRENITKEEMEEKFKQLTKELKMEKKSTSKYIRSKQSAVDKRKSSEHIGSIAIVMMVIPFSLIVLLDLIPMIQWLFVKIFH